ncbi:MAG: B12-binding domain-containing radical SAM protein, partial [Thermotaleaceae bacterium]
MKVLLTTLNAKYIHTSLALRYLFNYSKEAFSRNITLQEYTINHSSDYILGEIYKGDFQIICFSCYIWNIANVLEIVNNLKKIKPEAKIILGGPEVSFEGKALMEEYPEIDYIVVGEGEATFHELLGYLIDGRGQVEDIAGILYRHQTHVKENQERELISELDAIPSPYEDKLEGFENKILYYESSRGCPYNCSYCLSSTIKGVRFFSIARVKKDLLRFLDGRVKQVKFVDRTFNAKKRHSLEIMKYLQERDNGYTNFHFEITADLLDEEILDFLSTVREGLFQFEVGVQTTYDKTMMSIDRRVDFRILSDVVRKISTFRNIHLHLDLIAGLPHEDFQRFSLSFNDVYQLKPEKIQLGFLKLLKGSGIRRDSELHEYIFKAEAPYEILENKYISYGELLKLKMLEEMVEIYYNSGFFEISIAFILANFYTSPFDFYQNLSEYWEQKGYHHNAHDKNGYYKILLDFYEEMGFSMGMLFKEVLKLDYLKQGKTTLPQFFLSVEIGDFRDRCHRFLQSDENISKYLEDYQG